MVACPTTNLPFEVTFLMKVFPPSFVVHLLKDGGRMTNSSYHLRAIVTWRIFYLYWLSSIDNVWLTHLLFQDVGSWRLFCFVPLPRFWILRAYHVWLSLSHFGISILMFWYINSHLYKSISIWKVELINYFNAVSWSEVDMQPWCREERWKKGHILDDSKSIQKLTLIQSWFTLSSFDVRLSIKW